MTIAISGTTGITLAGQFDSASTFGFKNRIINPGMVIDQRNAGASGTAVGYTVDRFGYYGTQASKGTWQQNAGSVTPPTGFKNYLGFTSSSAYSVLSTDLFEFYQSIEGLNLYDLAWGTASAATVTLSFWVRSSLTGTFGGSLTNNGNTRNYPFTYTISSSNTWEQKTVTVAGDTTGTWLTTNGVGMVVIFGLGAGSTYSGTANAWNGTTSAILPTGATSVVGTSGATFYITGVQLEKGSTATSFDYRPYGTELALCQRYYVKTFDTSVAPAQNAGRSGSLRAYAWTTAANSVPIGITWQFPVEMRTNPSTVTTYNPNNANSSWRNNGNTGDVVANVAEAGTRQVLVYINGALGATDSFVIQATASAEL